MVTKNLTPTSENSYNDSSNVKITDQFNYEEYCEKCDSHYTPWITDCKCKKYKKWDKQKFDRVINQIKRIQKGDEMNIYQKMLTVSQEAPKIAKDTTIKQGYSSYQAVSHDGVISAIRPLLIKVGLVLCPKVISHEVKTEVVSSPKGGDRLLYFTQMQISVMLINADDPKEQVETISWGYGQDYGDKGVGKAYSYAVKYAILKLFNLETGDNDEERVDVPKRPQQTASTQKYIMPFGKKKGYHFSKIDHKDLMSAIEWCASKNDEGKFTSLIDEIKEYLDGCFST